MKRQAILACAVAALLACVALVGCSQGSGNANNAITVSASANAIVQPDTASIGIVVAGDGETEVAALEAAEKKAHTISERLKGIGAKSDDISVKTSDATYTTKDAQGTHESSGYYDWDGNWVESEGESYYSYQQEVYEVIATIQVSNLDISQVNTVMREAAAAGAVRFANLSFSVHDREAAYQQALSAAVDAAHEKAESLAKASGVYVGRVVNVIEESEASEEALTSSGDASRYKPGDVTTLELETVGIPVEANVTVSYAIS